MKRIALFILGCFTVFHLVSAQDTNERNTNEFEHTGRQSRFMPNDSLFLLDKQWYLSYVNIFDAWNITMGSPAIKVAIIDNGSFGYEHPDLGYGNDSYRNVDETLGYDFYNNTNNLTYPTRHATMVAGVLGAKTNNATGVAGICGGNGSSAGVTMIPIAAGIGEGIKWNEVHKAIKYAVDKGARVINMSIGLPIGNHDYKKNKNAIDTAIAYAVQNNVVLVAATGNSGNAEVSYPACHQDVIAVGAVKKDTMRWEDSNYSHYDDLYDWPGDDYGLDVVAPGVDIWSTAINQQDTLVPPYYDSYFATSFSAPIVSGIAALILSVNPNLTSQQVKNIIESTAKRVRLDKYIYNETSSWPYWPANWNNEMGFGLVDAHAAILAALETVCTNGLPRVHGTITQNTTWNTALNAIGFTIIPNGVTLTITNTVWFDSNAQIIVEPGGKLIIDGGTLTNACPGEMWQGITVLGDPTKPTHLQYQGFAHLLNNGSIENALCGIKVKDGGKVSIDNASFINNKMGVKFEPLSPIQSGNVGSFYRANFVIDNAYFGNMADFEAHITAQSSGAINVSRSNFSSKRDLLL